MKIDSFRVSYTILLRVSNSDQSSIKCCDLPCDVEPPLLKSCKNLSMKLKVKYILPTSNSDRKFYIYELPEGLRVRKTLTHGTRMQKNPQTRKDIFWIFTDVGPSSNFHLCTKISAMTLLTPKLSNECRMLENHLV